MWSVSFWTSALERSIATFAQTLLACMGADDGLGLLDAGWATSLSVSGLAALVCLLTCMARSPLGSTGPGMTETINKG